MIVCFFRIINRRSAIGDFGRCLMETETLLMAVQEQYGTLPESPAADSSPQHEALSKVFLNLMS